MESTFALPTDMAVIADALRDARELMNEEGAHWTQGNWYDDNGEGETAYCSIGALRQVTGYWVGKVESRAVIRDAAQVLAEEAELLAFAQGKWGLDLPSVGSTDRVIEWNDDAARTWEEVEALFERAEARARAAASV